MVTRYPAMDSRSWRETLCLWDTKGLELKLRGQIFTLINIVYWIPSFLSNIHFIVYFSQIIDFVALYDNEIIQRYTFFICYGSSFFHLDDRFVMKQMSRLEVQSFVDFGPRYFAYINEAVKEKVSGTTAVYCNIFISSVT